MTRTVIEVRVREFARSVAVRTEGASAVEYALLVGLIALVIIAGVTLLGTSLNGKFSEVATHLSS